MSVATRGDDFFGKHTRVRAPRLFQLGTHTPGLKLVADENPAFEPLYAELDELLGRADAFEAGSETRQRIDEVNAELTRLERADAEALRERLEQDSLFPLEAGAAFERELTDVLSSAGYHPADHAAPDDR